MSADAALRLDNPLVDEVAQSHLPARCEGVVERGDDADRNGDACLDRDVAAIGREKADADIGRPVDDGADDVGPVATSTE